MARREADFLNVIFWGKLAETLVSYGSKGSLISIDGELRTRKYEKTAKQPLCDRNLRSIFPATQSCAQRAMHENNTGDDLADLVLKRRNYRFKQYQSQDRWSVLKNRLYFFS